MKKNSRRALNLCSKFKKYGKKFAKLVEKPHVFHDKFPYFITRNPHVFLFWDHYTLCKVT